MNGVPPAHQANQLMDGVFAVVRSSDDKKRWFDKFIAIFSGEPTHAELVKKLRDCVEEKRTLI